MWFDARAKLAEITEGPGGVPHVASVASVATQLPSKPLLNVANVAEVARPCASPSASDPRTWTGRIVSLDAWRRLSDWERHGPNGRHWCGLCREWHLPGHCEGGRT